MSEEMIETRVVELLRQTADEIESDDGMLVGARYSEGFGSETNELQIEWWSK